MLDQAIHSLAYAHGRPSLRGRLRVSPEDFTVTEIPSVEPAGEGEHVWLWVRKRNQTTTGVAAQLARLAAVHPRQVSYAGLKDRRAVTEQWFSVQLPGRGAPDWSTLDSDSVQVLRALRHTRKLRRGTLAGNRFRIVLRDTTGPLEVWQQRLDLIRLNGVPNYFGEQRFGRDGSNLVTAQALFANPRKRMQRDRRSLALSAARSLLFNQVLSRRVQSGTWNRAIRGDAMQLEGSHSFFIADTVDAELLARLERHDVHPTGPLHGRGVTPVRADSLELELAVLREYADWCAGLEAAGLKQDRRALCLVVGDLAGEVGNDGDWRLQFSLPAGAYATSVLRELVDVSGW
jgi:tRNA pseudouridine13 synthase